MKVYPGSARVFDGVKIYMARDENEKRIIAEVNENVNGLYGELSGEEKISNTIIKSCPLSRENARVLRKYFKFTNPVSHKGKKITIGLGDRLGLASAGHIKLINDFDIFPVLAQQSMRELNLTNRTYEDVLDAATFAVFQEGYEKGFGADGDHLKTADEVKNALGCGFTMITLDASEHIMNAAFSMTDDEINNLYENLSDDQKKYYDETYLYKNHEIGDGLRITFDGSILRRIAMIYRKAVDHAADIYMNIIKNCGREIDFEMSIDETTAETTPEAHFFTANELRVKGVVPVSLAPRFCGEFQKGIEYRGDINKFENDFIIHAAIAKKFGYKLSVHSGSDKFSVFGAVGDITKGNYHLKTAGTNWLEALRVIALKNPRLFREILKTAVERLPDAKKYYHITENAKNIPDADALPDNELPALLNQDDSRQVLHVTYGYTLAEYKKEIYETLYVYEDDYYEALKKHIGKHLDALRIKK